MLLVSSSQFVTDRFETDEWRRMRHGFRKRICCPLTQDVTSDKRFQGRLRSRRKGIAHCDEEQISAPPDTGMAVLAHLAPYLFFKVALEKNQWVSQEGQKSTLSI
ncbi:hypothetical protein DUI87_04297 [Hirundo rustica rustica]|uniref:Uncharacterized protein n=1 Tax=Hirundo rustica rustica TaxID=333673 RepID=A0A3M0L5Y7_HIRRU|nr:hypothetical protein DUI87_04297 [Hirundo rustica rustica]